MAVLAQFDGRKAFLRQGTWVSANRALERRLNEATEAWIRETGGPLLSDADPERTVARTIAARFGGRILIHQPGDPRESRRVYFDRRQLRLY
jgi:hypothetical protein